jgi:hypothetical protein
LALGAEVPGFLYFTGVKLAGYTAYSHYLRNMLDDPSDRGFGRTFKIGGTRTLIGLAAGLSYGALAWATHLFDRGDASTVIYLLGLLPIRIAEWWLLLWLFFPMKNEAGKIGKGVTFGIIVSYLLDALGILAALVIPGGAWVC